MSPFFTGVKQQLEAKGYTVTDNTEEGFFVAENNSKVYTIDYKNAVLEELDVKGQLHIQDIHKLDITEAEIKVAS